MAFSDELRDATSSLRDFSEALDRATSSVLAGGAGGGQGGGGGGGALFGFGGRGLTIAGAIGTVGSLARAADPFIKAGIAGGSQGVAGAALDWSQWLVGNTPIVGSMLGVARADFAYSQALDQTRDAYAPLAESGVVIDPENVKQTFRNRYQRAERRYDFDQKLVGEIEPEATKGLRRSFKGSQAVGGVAGQAGAALGGVKAIGGEEAVEVLNQILDAIKGQSHDRGSRPPGGG